MAVNGDAQNSAFLEQCLTGIAQNDSESLAALYHGTSNAVYGYAFSILKNAHDAQDILHDCYLRIHAAAASYHPDGKPMAWILTITRNLCYMRLRQGRKTTYLSDDEWNALPGEHLTSDDRLVLGSCLQQLSDEERQIVMLHAVAGLRHREIARHLDLSLSTVLSKYHRAIKKIRNAMQAGE